ncbi:MAG: ABC transporter substrate-binding protein, partial [bacterium]
MANAHPNPTVAQLRLNEGADPIVQVKTLINNGVQGIIAVPPPNRPELSSSDEVSLKSYDLRSWWFIAVNTKSGPMADPKVRQALNLLIDRERLRELAIGVKPGEQNSPCELISGPFVQSSPYYNRAIPVVAKADKAKADALLKAAGLTQEGGSWMYKGTKVTLRIGLLAPLDFEAPDLLDQIGNQL